VGVLEAVGGLISSGWNTLKGAGEVVWTAVKSVYNFAAGIFSLVGAAWDWMVNGVGWLGDNLIGAAARILHTLEWVTLHMIPRAVAWAIGKAVRWAEHAVKTLEHYLLGALRAAEHWLLGALHTLEHWAKGAINQLWHPVRDLWNWFTKLARHAVDLVLHPDRLAAWLVGALVLPLLKWLLARSAPIIVWLVKGAAGLLPTLARTLEDALAKLI
jgi:hypothetical protein